MRTGDNSFAGSSSSILVPLTVATGVDNQNLAFCNSTAFGKFLIFNDKQTSGNGQVFLNTTTTPSVVKAATATDGTTLTLDLGSFNAPNSAASYDFSFDVPTQTLAITDFGNRRLFVFRVGVPVSVTGKLNSVGVSAQAPDQQATIEFRPTGTTQFRFTRTVTVPTTGNFTLSDIPPGTYTLHVKTPRYLAKNVEVDATTNATISVAIDQLPGDINGDNAIDFGDLSTLLQVYNALNDDPLYATQPLADLNQDGGIDFGDLSSMLLNYNAFGDD